MEAVKADGDRLEVDNALYLETTMIKVKAGFYLISTSAFLNNDDFWKWLQKHNVFPFNDHEVVSWKLDKY